MSRIIIEEMKLPNDKNSINEWHNEQKHTSQYETIEHYILEGYLMSNLAEVIETNYELLNIDYREVKKALIVKNNNQIIGFLLCDDYDMNEYASMLYLQYIVFKPNSQHKGYGTETLNEFFSN